MKRFKSGFSLAEVLLALAIVAIIATLGFTMSRKGIERAYSQYIYTGYNALSIAIADANANGKYYDPNGGDDQVFYKHIYNLLNEKKELSAASDIPVIANNFIKLPFMGVITGAIVEGGNWYDLKDSDINTTTNDQQWGMTEDGWSSDDGSGPVVKPMNPNITGQGGGNYGAGKCKHGNPEEDCQQCLIEKYTCPHGNHIATCNICHSHPDPQPDPQPGDNPDNPDNPDTPDNNPDTTTSKDYTTITAANGIVYTLNEGSMERFTHHANGNPKYEDVNFLSIAMSVPSPKNKNNAAEGYNLMYIPNSGYPLIPYSGQELAKIADRIDILSYVIDDGETGRVGPDGNYKPLKRYTFREAVCHYNPDGYKIKPNSTDTGNYYVDLFGCPEGIEPVQGALQLVGPRR